jgi:hypothetical protein
MSLQQIEVKILRIKKYVSITIAILIASNALSLKLSTAETKEKLVTPTQRVIDIEIRNRRM